MNVSLKKTKAMVFSNKLRKNNKLSFTFNNKAFETVSQFTYLAVTIKSPGSFLPNNSSQSIKFERAILALNNRLRLKQSPIDIAIKLFGSCINHWLPLNNMSYKNWDSTEIETSQLYFLKHMLGYNRSSTNIPVRGELEKFPLKCAIDFTAVKFYKHILKSDNEIIQNCTTVDRNLFSDSFRYSFVRYLKNLQQNLCGSNIQSKISKLLRSLNPK